MQFSRQRVAFLPDFFLPESVNSYEYGPCNLIDVKMTFKKKSSGKIFFAYAFADQMCNKRENSEFWQCLVFLFFGSVISGI